MMMERKKSGEAESGSEMVSDVEQLEYEVLASTLDRFIESKTTKIQNDYENLRIFEIVVCLPLNSLAPQYIHHKCCMSNPNFS